MLMGISPAPEIFQRLNPGIHIITDDAHRAMIRPLSQYLVSVFLSVESDTVLTWGSVGLLRLSRLDSLTEVLIRDNDSGSFVGCPATYVLSYRFIVAGIVSSTQRVGVGSIEFGKVGDS
ncbi:unnamed protein product [Lota lota]